MRGADPLPSGAYQTEEQRGRHDCRTDQCSLIPPCEFTEAIDRRGRTCLHRLVLQMAVNVSSEASSGFISPVSVLLQCLHYDPVQLATYVFAQSGRINLPICSDRW